MGAATRAALRFVYRRTGPSLLVAEGRLNTKGQAVVSRSKTGRGKVTAPIFLLVPQVKLPKRLDLARDADRALDSVPGLIVANWVEAADAHAIFDDSGNDLIYAGLISEQGLKFFSNICDVCVGMYSCPFKNRFKRLLTGLERIVEGHFGWVALDLANNEIR
jgi:hypothetical protein